MVLVGVLTQRLNVDLEVWLSLQISSQSKQLDAAWK